MFGGLRVPSSKRQRPATASGGGAKRARASAALVTHRAALFGLDASRSEEFPLPAGAPVGVRCRPGRGDGSLDAAYFNDGTFVPMFEPHLRKIKALAQVPGSGGAGGVVELSVPPLAKGKRCWSRPWTQQERHERRQLVLRLFAQDADFYYSDAALTPRLEGAVRASRRGGGGGDDGGGSSSSSSSSPAYIVSAQALHALRPVCQTELQGAGETGACMAAAMAHLVLLQGEPELLRSLGGRGKVHAAASAAHTQALELHRAEQRGGGALADQGLETLAQLLDYLPATAMAALGAALRYQQLRGFYDTNYHCARFVVRRLGQRSGGGGGGSLADAITASKVRWLEALLRGGRAVVLSVAKLAHCMLCVGCSSRHLLFVNSFGEDTEWGGLIALDKLAVVANIVDAAWLGEPEGVGGDGGGCGGGGGGGGGGGCGGGGGAVVDLT